MGRPRAILEGKTGGPEFRYRLYRSNKAGEELGEMGDVKGASASLSNFRDHTWELSVPKRNSQRSSLEFFGSYVKLVIELRDGEEWLRYPFGLYRFDPPKGRSRPHSTDLALLGKSPESALMDSSAHDGYGRPAGSWVLGSVREILLDHGFETHRIDFPTIDKALPTGVYFDPLQDAEGVRWLRICNALLAAGGFYALYCDAEGRFTTKEIEDLSARSPDVVYGSTSDSERLIGDASGDAWVDFDYDDERFANRTVVYSQDPNQSPPVVSVAEIRAAAPVSPEPGVLYLLDPDSGGAVDVLGATVQKEPTVLQTLVSQADADRIARATLRLAHSMSLKLSFPTIPDPRRGPREVYGLRVVADDGTELFGDTWPVTGFSMALDLTEMTHEVSRLVRA